MSNNTEIISQYIGVEQDNAEITSNNQLIQRKIIPYRIQHTIIGTIYEFWRVNSENRSDIYNSDIAKELAMIVVNEDKTHFRLQYYPLDKNDLQVRDNIPISDLYIAINDLLGAGF